jgi:hypothetical protein
MSSKPQYDQELRAIGQALEAQGISVFEMKRHSERYVVNGAPEKPSSLFEALRQFRNQNGPRTLNFGPQELLRLEWRGCRRRQSPDALPDFYSVSNLLRTIGGYLDRKNGELLGLEKRPLSLTLMYQTQDGHPYVEDRTIASFYDIFIDQYSGRARR